MAGSGGAGLGGARVRPSSTISLYMFWNAVAFGCMTASLLEFALGVSMGVPREVIPMKFAKLIWNTMLEYQQMCPRARFH